MLGVYTLSTYFYYTKAILIRRKLWNNSQTTTAFGLHTDVLNNWGQMKIFNAWLLFTENLGGWQVPPRGPPVRHCLKCQPNLSTWEQPLLPALDVFDMRLVIKRPSQGAAAEMLPKNHNPTYSSWTPYRRQDKISVIEQQAYNNKAFIIALQETHWSTADKLVMPNFSLAG